MRPAPFASSSPKIKIRRHPDDTLHHPLLGPVDYNPHIMHEPSLACLVVFLCATGAYAQSAGTITGTVVDSDGETVANAQVQATNR